MDLYPHNYKILSETDFQLFSEYKKKMSEQSIFSAEEMFSGVFEDAFNNKFLRHYDSFFPNNYLEKEDVYDNHEKYIQNLKDFNLILANEQAMERHLLKFIKDTGSYFIPASILKLTNFGHQDRYIFPEFELSVEYRADYLIVGKNSFGFQFLFVEFENPYGRIIDNGGNLGETFRKGVSQVEDWSSFLDRSFASLKSVFNKKKHPELQLPDEFSEYDKTRISFAVVAGKRANFKPKTYQLKDKHLRNKIHILHYDNLIDLAERTLSNGEYW